MYKDPQLKEEIQYIDFGIVKAGESKEVTVYLYNDSKATLTQLQFEFSPLPEPSLTVLEAPKTIQPGEVAKLVLKWSPTENFKQALQTSLIITGQEVYYSARAVRKE